MSKPVTMDEDQVALIKGMLERGDRQMDIATYFGINQARVNELKNETGGVGRRYRHVQAAARCELPEPGPYVVVGRGGYERLKVAAAIPAEMLSQLIADVSWIRGRLS